MPHYTARITWQRGEQAFIDNRYSRKHVIQFDGGAELPASSSPHVVRVPMSDPSAVDPEELFVASISSCHMLWFLSIAAERKFSVDQYIDNATGVMAKAQDGKVRMTEVTLHPAVSFSGKHQPSDAEFTAMHHHAHDECFIANSVRTEVRCDPVLVRANDEAAL